jgi:hypothetical protein
MASIRREIPSSSHDNALCSDKFRLQFRFAILQEQFNNLFEIVIQLVQGFPLRMGAPQSRNISDKKPCVGTLLNRRYRLSRSLSFRKSIG